jgi:hypothetical protein
MPEKLRPVPEEGVNAALALRQAPLEAVSGELLA